MTAKFPSELNTTTTLDPTDLAVLQKTGESEVKALTGGNLKSSLLNNIDTLNFNTSYVSGGEPIGAVYWNSDEETFDFRLTADATGQLFEEVFFGAKNQTGSPITNITPVMFAGTLGASGRILMQPALADGSIPPEYTMGLVTETVENGGDGKVTWFGKLRGVNTTGSLFGETWNDGDLLFVSPTTAGYLTNVEPNTPNRRILVASVIKAHANGTLQVRPTWTNKLTELDDVNGTPLTINGQLLVWDNDNSFFDFTSNISDFVSLDVNGDLPVTGRLVLSKATYTTTGSVNGSVSSHKCNSATPFTLTITDGTTDGETIYIRNVNTGLVTFVGNIGITGATELAQGESVVLEWDTTDGEWQ